MSINTFGDSNSKDEILERLSLNLKNDKAKMFEIDALAKECICLSIKKPIAYKIAYKKLIFLYF